jgi:hypothetical protein
MDGSNSEGRRGGGGGGKKEEEEEEEEKEVETQFSVLFPLWHRNTCNICLVAVSNLSCSSIGQTFTVLSTLSCLVIQ